MNAAVHAVIIQNCVFRPLFVRAAVAQLGERQTEDLKVPGSIPGLGIFYRCFFSLFLSSH